MTTTKDTTASTTIEREPDMTATADTTIFHVTPDSLQAIATLHHATPQAKNDREMTPVIANIQLTVNVMGEYQAIATDRYVVAEISGHLPSGEGNQINATTEIQLESRDFVELAKRAKQAGTLIKIVHTPGKPLEAFDYSGMPLGAFTVGTGNYPPVANLFESSLENAGAIEVIGVDPIKLARLGKIHAESTVSLRPGEKNGMALILNFTASSDASKPGPAYVTRPRRYGDSDYRALIQPVIHTL